MPEPRNCPNCGASLAARAPEGLCPRCLLGAGLGRESLTRSSRGEPAITMSAGPSGGARSVLVTIADAVGSVPHVLLRDTDAGFEPPIVQPDRGAQADLSLRYRIDGEIAPAAWGKFFGGATLTLAATSP